MFSVPKLYTVYAMKYVYRWLSFLSDQGDLYTYILQNYSTGLEAIAVSSECPWRYPEEYW